jgi:hypothetical protein
MGDRTDEIRSTRAPTLREDQIEILRRYGETRKTEAGQVLFRVGDTLNDFIVVLEGAVELDEYGFIPTGRALDGSALEGSV